MGEYAGETNELGLALEVLLGFSRIDTLCDIRDLKAVTNRWYEAEINSIEAGEERTFWDRYNDAARTALYSAAVISGIGILKYGDDLIVVNKTGENLDVFTKNGDELTKIGRVISKGDLTEESLKNNIKTLREERVGKLGDLVNINYKNPIEKLNWDNVIGKKGETRIEHVKLHEINNLSKPEHGVFYGNSKDTINNAWQNRANGYLITYNEKDIYIIPYENAGYAGGYCGQGNNLNYVTIITQKDTNNIITGFPGNGYKYSQENLIGEN